MLDSLAWASENLLLCVARKKDADGAETGKSGGRSTKGNADGAAMVLSAEALRRVEALNRRSQRELLECCREDTLFFFKGFVDLFEPRLGDEGANEPQVVPFIPWPHNLDAIQYADKWMGKRDIRVNKSRAQGASYLYSMMFLHHWLFHPMFKVNIVSKDQDAADNPKDPDRSLVSSLLQCCFGKTNEDRLTERQGSGGGDERTQPPTTTLIPARLHPLDLAFLAAVALCIRWTTTDDSNASRTFFLIRDRRGSTNRDGVQRNQRRSTNELTWRPRQHYESTTSVVDHQVSMLSDRPLSHAIRSLSVRPCRGPRRLPTDRWRSWRW